MTLRIIIPATVHWTATRYVFLLIGIVCLGIYGYAYVERAVFQSYESSEFDLFAERAAASAAAAGGDIAPGGTAAARVRRASAPRVGAPGGTIGRLSVARLGLSAMVREGIDGRTLQLAVGHIPATALPGEAGNIGLAGHRDTFFRGLKDIQASDEIKFATAGGDFRYVVESLAVVEPDNVSLLAPSADNVLTLVTCFPFSYVGPAPKRFVIRARQVSPSRTESVVE